MTTERRIADIQAKIAERAGKPGYKRNVEAMRTELAKLQSEKPKDVAP